MFISQALYDSTFGAAWHVKGKEIAQQMVYVTYAGTPVSNLTPSHIGQACFDTAGEDFYLATGVTDTDWKQITA